GCNPSIHAVHHGGGKKESARNRQAARRAQMSQEQKDEINRKRRETRLRNKIQDSSNMSSGRTTLGNADTEVTPTMMDASNNNSPGRTPCIPLVDPDGHRKAIAITGAASRHAQLTREKKDEINKKRREARLQKKLQSSNKENNNPGSRQWLLLEGLVPASVSTSTRMTSTCYAGHVMENQTLAMNQK
ncbi:unnamed protein product, partial [Urochloa humidicola]